MDLIFTIKFVHVIAAAVMIGAWLCLALFVVMAHRSGNTAVVALTAQFVVRADYALVAPALAVQAVSGFPLGWAEGLDPMHEFWTELSLPLFAVLLACWFLALRLELRIRGVARQAALDAKRLPDSYRRLFRLWCLAAVPILIGMVALFALMIWQPRLD